MSTTKNDTDNQSTKTEEKYDFSRMIRNRLEKRILDHIELIHSVAPQDTEQNLMMQAQVIQELMNYVVTTLTHKGYPNVRGQHVPLRPLDIVSLQQVTEGAIRLRNNLLMLPNSLKDAAELTELVNRNPESKNVENNHVGLAELPQMIPVDANLHNNVSNDIPSEPVYTDDPFTQVDPTKLLPIVDK